MPRTRTTRWDAAAQLRSAADMAAYLEAALADGDPTVITAALGDLARAKGMTAVALKAGLGRESLYKALSPHGNPELATVLRVLKALGLKLRVVDSPTARELRERLATRTPVRLRTSPAQAVRAERAAR
jgi:probable addiction module antidote protein